jgi:hypothetical protein
VYTTLVAIPALKLFRQKRLHKNEAWHSSVQFLDEAEHDEQDRMIRGVINELVQVSIVSE